MLGQVLRHRKEFVEIDDLATYQRPRVQLHAQGIVLRDQVPGALIKTKRQQVCRAGEFLVAEIDAKVGGFGIVPADLDGAIVSSHYFLFEIDGRQLEQRFLNYFILTAGFRDQIEAQGSTNYAAIRPADVLAYETPLPPLDAQRRIVALLDQLRTQIEQASALRREAHQEAASLIEANVRLIRAQGQWPEQTLAEACEILDHLRRPVNSTERAVRAGPVPYYGAGRQVGWIDDFLFNEELVLLAEDGGPFDSRCAYMISGRSWVNNHAHVLRGRSATNPWLMWMLRTTDLRPYVSGSTRSKLPQSKMRTIPIPVPPVDEQRRWIRHLEQLEHELTSVLGWQADTDSELKALMPAVLDRAFNGDL